MPRIRTIKPETAEDEKLGAVSRDARLMFILLWTICDDHGRFRAAPVHLRSRLFGYDDASLKEVVGWLGELATIGRVQLYEVDGERYGVVANWSKHQRIDNASKPLYPEPPILADNTPVPPQPSANHREPPQGEADHGDSPLDLDLDLDLEGTTPTSSSATPLTLVPDPPSPPATRRTDIQTVFETWREATGKRKARLDANRRRCIERALRDYPLEDVLDAVQGWRNSPHHRGENDRQTTYNSLDLLLRNAEKIEMFRDLHRRPSTPTGPPARSRSAAALDRVMAEMEGTA